MKKALILVTVISMLLGFGAITAFADFGTGAQAVASDVNIIRTGLRGQKITFSDADVKAALALVNFKSITVTSIPPSTEGTLLLGGKRVSQGKVIKRKNIASLVFVPASADVSESRFTFTVDGYGGGAELECLLRFIDKVNYAPTTEEGVSVSTQADISVFGNLSAKDPEGDALEYIVVAYPKHGTLTVSDSESGKFCYLPESGHVGSDKFTYVVRDEYGNYSSPAKVTLKTTERMCDTVYVDMTEREEYNAAVAMTAMNVMGGRLLGDDVYFMPDERMSRAEFIAVAMKACGIKADSTLTSTYFDDNSDIPKSLMPYIATAQRLGVIDGDFKDGALLFSPNESITHYEAAKILAALTDADTDGEESVFAIDDDIPVWARSSVAAMFTLGVFDDETVLSENVTRADTAKYLYRLK